ncbi:MAG: BsuBI/PstI family type II restriction endonuclease [Gallionella sp.]|nr:BsuBI/PstI family type II restriction endonuclease [Gallionella sp.]
MRKPDIKRAEAHSPCWGEVMRKFLSVVAWETEVWCASDPTHLIHFNGIRFLGPYAK